MKRTYFLSVTAIIEGLTGLLFLFVPAVLLTFLLGKSSATTEAVFWFRFFGAALFIFSIGCWLVRNDYGRPKQLGLLIAALSYDVAAAVVLAYLGSIRDMAGVALWPAVLAHTALAIWGLMSLWNKPDTSFQNAEESGK